MGLKYIDANFFLSFYLLKFKVGVTSAKVVNLTLLFFYLTSVKVMTAAASFHCLNCYMREKKMSHGEMIFYYKISLNMNLYDHLAMELVCLKTVSCVIMC